MKNNMIPLEHPGLMLKEDYLDDLGIKPGTLARHLNTDRSNIRRIISGERDITADMSLRLGLFFDMSPDFWYNLQSDYNMRVAKRDNLKELQETVKPLSLVVWKLKVTRQIKGKLKNNINRSETLVSIFELFLYGGVC